MDAPRRRPHVWWALALGSALALAACGSEDPTPPTASHGHERGHGHDRGHRSGELTAAHEELPEAAPAQLTHVRGEVLRSGGPTSEGADLEGGETLRIAEGGGADVDLRGGARVVLAANTEAQITSAAGAQLLVALGATFAAMPPGSSGPREPLRVATPACAVELAGSGEFYLVAHESGATWVVALSGLATVTMGDADSRGRPRSVDLPPGRALLVTTRIADPTEAPRTLDAARAAAAQIFTGLPALDMARASAEVRAAATRLDEALGWLEAEARRGRELTASHREAVRAGESDRALAIQRELVTHATSLHALRQVATARWERLQAAWLVRVHHGALAPDEHPLDQRRDRVSSLLGP